MKDGMLALYHALPAPMQSAVASLRGWHLRYWRYGPDTERLVAEAVEREYWTQPQWQRFREERLVIVLRRAATRVPHYRALWAQRRRQGDRSAIEDLSHWPLLDKETASRP